MDSSFAPRVLLVLPQLPQDPGGGASRSLTTICEMLAASGFSVHALAATACADTRSKPAEILQQLGINFSLEKRKRPEFLFQHHGVSFRLIDVGNLSVSGWAKIYGRHFDAAFDDELRTFQPDAIFTFGGLEDDLRRHRRARNAGAKVVFGLRNELYLTTNEWYRYVDAILTPSRFLTELYRERIGLESTPMLTPIAAAEIVAEERDPIFLTMVNPAAEKGVIVFARLAEELSKQRPDIPILVIESRGSAGLVAAVGDSGGFDLRRHENVMFSPAVPTPKDIYLPTRLLAVPSLMDAAPRVIAESLLNGIPPLVSNRGGLPEMAGEAGQVFPIPDSITINDRLPVSPEVVQPWIEVIIHMFDDEDFYQAECGKAREAAKRFLPEVLGPQYVKFFREIIAKG